MVCLKEYTLRSSIFNFADVSVVRSFINSSPAADSENLNFVAPLEEHRFYGIFCFFGLPAFILKT